MNFSVAPDPISNRSITKTNSILPPGFFFTRVAYSSIIEHATTGTTVLPEITVNKGDMNQYLLSLYLDFVEFNLDRLPVKEGLNDKVLETGIDGYTEKYSLNDIIPSNSNGSGPLTMTLFNEY